MKTFFPYVIGLFVWMTHSHAADEVLQARADLVFPFKVGQQYQFKAGQDFAGPLGPTLLANTVAEITITEVVFDTSTYLHVPYWAAFGTGYYRLDDSYRIWNYDPRDGEESVLLNLRTVPGGRWASFSAWNCAGGFCTDYMNDHNEQELDTPLHWGYAEDPESFVNRIDGVQSGWTIFDGDSVLIYTPLLCCPDQGRVTVFGRGASRHYFGLACCGQVLWGHCRPASSAPWPMLSSEIVGIRRSTWGEIKSRFAPSRAAE